MIGQVTSTDLSGHVKRGPSHLVGVGLPLMPVVDEARVLQWREGEVFHGGTDAVEPRALVCGAWRSKRPWGMEFGGRRQ